MAQRTSSKLAGDFSFFVCVTLVQASFCAHILVSLDRLVDTRPRVFTLDFQDGEKISSCVDLRNKEKNYSVQISKTMQGVHGRIGQFDIVFLLLWDFRSGKSFVLYNFPFA